MMNYLIIILDSARYDTFEKAKTANIEKIGPLEKAHSQSASTIYSVLGYLYNLGPIRNKILTNEKGQKYSLAKSDLIENIPKHTWLASYFKEKGYITGFFTGNPLLYFVFKRHFDRDWDIFLGAKYNEQHCIKEMINDLIAYTQLQPFFYVIIPMDTHFGYFNGKESYGFLAPWFEIDLQKAYQFQIKSIEWCDRQIGRLIPKLKNCVVVITSDHGDIMGEYGDFYGQSVRKFGHGTGVLSPYLFRVPFIRGHINKS